MERLQTFGLIRDLDTENRRVRAVVSTNQRARDEAIIEQRGWDFTNWDKNGVVLWAHDDRSLPIARALAADREVTDTELIETHQFANTERAREVFDLVRDGYVNAVSIRWLPGETEMKRVDGKPTLVFVRGHQPLEESYVPVPADTGAMVLRADGTPFDATAYMRGMLDDESFCCVEGCRNPAPIAFTLCDECQELLELGRSARAERVTAADEARAARVATWAEKFRAASKALKGEAA